MKIYHNPRCSKSRCALQLLEEKGVKFELVKYLENAPSKDELKELLRKLNMKAEDIVRKSETVYKEKYKGKLLTEDEWLDALTENPILIERPIFVNGEKAIIGRPPEKVFDIL